MPSLWSTKRRGTVASGLHSPEIPLTEHRTAFERDYDRLLFSTPVRRMADKTQVFPLERNDSVRTRLTHCHEVSNLARSIANRILRKKPEAFGSEDAAKEAPVVLATVGLAHDLGNPPFGHQGEVAIRNWFGRKSELFDSDNGALSEDQKADFLKFEGNAQTLRLLTKLQVSVGGHGLDLTAASLASVMKYTVPAAKISKARKSTAKAGYFLSEAAVVEWIRSETGLSEGDRHPLVWLMEACDDIAYSVLDVEDAVKKSFISAEDVLAYLKKELGSENTVVKTLVSDFQKADVSSIPTQSHEIRNAYLRTRLIEALLVHVADTVRRQQLGDI